MEGTAPGCSTAAPIATSLPIAGQVIAFELALRFLDRPPRVGDVYFRIARPSQNLERAACQLALLVSMQAQSEAMLRCLERA